MMTRGGRILRFTGATIVMFFSTSWFILLSIQLISIVDGASATHVNSMVSTVTPPETITTRRSQTKQELLPPHHGGITLSGAGNSVKRTRGTRRHLLKTSSSLKTSELPDKEEYFDANEDTSVSSSSSSIDASRNLHNGYLCYIYSPSKGRYELVRFDDEDNIPDDEYLLSCREADSYYEEDSSYDEEDSGGGGGISEEAVMAIGVIGGIIGSAIAAYFFAILADKYCSNKNAVMEEADAQVVVAGDGRVNVVHLPSAPPLPQYDLGTNNSKIKPMEDTPWIKRYK